MPDHPNHRSESQDQRDPIPLDYGKAKNARVEVTYFRNNFLRLTAFIYTVGENVFSYCLGFLGPPPPGTSPTPGYITVLNVFMIIPLVVSFGFGCYSVKVAGISLRNILGVIGLVTPAVMILMPAIGYLIQLLHI
jgi:hypothetical protein